MNYIQFRDIDLAQAFIYDCPTCRAHYRSITCPKCQRILDPRINVAQIRASLATYLDGMLEGRLIVNIGDMLAEQYPADLARYLEQSAANLLLMSVVNGVFPCLITQARQIAQKHSGLKSLADDLLVALEADVQWYKGTKQPRIANPILMVFTQYQKERTASLMAKADTYMKALYSQNFAETLARFCVQDTYNTSLFVAPTDVRKKHEYQALNAVVTQFRLLFSSGNITSPEFAPLEVIA